MKVKVTTPEREGLWLTIDEAIDELDAIVSDTRRSPESPVRLTMTGEKDGVPYIRWTEETIQHIRLLDDENPALVMIEKITVPIGGMP